MSHSFTIPLRCLQCDVVFMADRPDRKFCGYPCFYEAKKASIKDRFWTTVNRNGPLQQHVPELGPCWEWTGRCDRGGYGHTTMNGKFATTHRVSWQLAFGKIPDKLCVLHKCDNRKCVNPSHLFLGTYKDNHADMNAKGRKQWPSGDNHPARINPSRMARGSKNGWAKLTEDQVREIRRLCQAGAVPKRLGSQFGVAETAIYSILNGRTWRHVT